MRGEREPAEVTASPAFAELVARARAQTAAPVAVTFEAVCAESRRRRLLRWAAQGGALLVAAVALLWILRPLTSPEPDESPHVAVVAPPSPVEARGAERGARVTPQEVGVERSTLEVELEGGGVVRSDPSARVEVAVDAREDASEGRRSVRLHDGAFEVVAGDRALEFLVYERVLDVAAGAAITVEVSQTHQRFKVQRGDARWREAQVAGAGTEGPGTAAEEVERSPGPEALARKAEAQMRADNRTGAIRTLSSLVRRYPRSGAAKAATLDLARLRKARGESSKAWCAYALFLGRWPQASNAAAVRRARDRLSPPPQGCRGLSPR